MLCSGYINSTFITKVKKNNANGQLYAIVPKISGLEENDFIVIIRVNDYGRTINDA